jgi:hypothetical protein
LGKNASSHFKSLGSMTTILKESVAIQGVDASLSYSL